MGYFNNPTVEICMKNFNHFTDVLAQLKATRQALDIQIEKLEQLVTKELANESVEEDVSLYRKEIKVNLETTIRKKVMELIEEEGCNGYLFLLDYLDELDSCWHKWPEYKPNKDGMYLTYMSSAIFPIQTNYYRVQDEAFTLCNMTYITHWQELPEYPKKRNNNG